MSYQNMMIEHVAEVLYHTYRILSEIADTPVEHDWKNMDPQDRVLWYTLAHASAGAMVNPSDLMLNAAVAEMKQPRIVPKDASWEQIQRSNFEHSYKAAIAALA